MEINYCLPIIKNNKEKVLEMINQNLSDYSYFEIWLDYVEDLDTDFLDFLISNHEERIIFVLRRQKLEDMSKTLVSAKKVSLDRRQKIIWQVANTKSYLDLDIKTQEDELNYIIEKNLKPNLILSFHDYENTPPYPALIDLLEDMEKYNPSIYKFSTFCNSEIDAVKLLNLLIHLKDKGVKFIVLGMGKEGLVTRIFGSLWGNEMIFAPKSLEEKSAEGQLTKDQLERIFEIIKVSS